MVHLVGPRYPLPHHPRPHTETRTLSRTRASILLTIALALLLPSSALAVGVPGRGDASSAPAFDTPAPADPSKTPKPTRKPTQPGEAGTPTGEPVAGAALVLGATPESLVPSRSALSIGYSEPGLMGQLPLLVAQLSGYFAEAGFEEVTIVETAAALRDATKGDLDFAVAPAGAAFKAYLQDPRLAR